MQHPVLLITFNRSQYVKQMLDSLKLNNIQKLYVFKDGPRPNNHEDELASIEIEKLIADISWECQVITNYMQNNLGCGYGPYSAISWAFQYEEELIILEDDCIPTPAFFEFTNAMLEKYRDNVKIRLISGFSQMTEHPIFDKYDYIFSQYAPTWGWATWRRVWKNFDIQMRNMNEFFRNGGFSREFSTLKEANFFNRRYKRDINDKNLNSHVWDSQFGYHIRRSGALAIIPSKNLISYIGIEGTHPVDINSTQFNLKTDEVLKMEKYPNQISTIREYDYLFFNKFVYVESNIIIRIFNYIKRYLF